MVKLLLIGAGGFLGSVSRYVLGGFVHRLLATTSFPYGTLTVNVFGCLLIGFLGGLSETQQVFSPEIRLFLFIGLIGGFTTFSTFGYETLSFVRDGQSLAVLSNIGLHLVLGLGAVWFGNVLSQFVYRKIL